MSTLLRHTAYCADTGHGEGDCCEAAPILIRGIGEVNVLGDDDGPVIYVDDPARRLYAETGKYEIDEAEKIALAMLEAVRIARSNEPSAHADARCEKGVH